MSMPHPSEEAKTFFKSMVPTKTGVTQRPMFGNNAAFSNGYMFMGLFGDDLFLRLSDEDAKKLLSYEGASLFEPMKGRPMKGYFVIPKTWWKKQETVQKWVASSLVWTNKLPPKKPKK